MKKSIIRDEAEHLLKLLPIFDKVAERVNDPFLTSFSEAVRASCGRIVAETTDTLPNRVQGESAIAASLRILRESGRPMTIRQIADAAGHPYPHIAVVVYREAKAERPRIVRAGSRPTTWVRTPKPDAAE